MWELRAQLHNEPDPVAAPSFRPLYLALLLMEGPQLLCWPGMLCIMSQRWMGARSLNELCQTERQGDNRHGAAVGRPMPHKFCTGSEAGSPALTP